MIRWKIAEMARRIESTHAMLENLTYQFCTMSKEKQNQELAGDCALIKVQATKVFEYCAREAAQIMGGVSYVRGGQGEKVERLYREARSGVVFGVCWACRAMTLGGEAHRALDRNPAQVRAYAIPGGSEEILLDLAARQAIKQVQAKL